MSASYSLNTKTTSVNIHINSEDATNFVGNGVDSGLINTSDFVIVLEDIVNCDEDTNMLVSIQSIEIPYTFYNVSNAINNNKFYFLEQGSETQLITLPSQNYNVNTIIETLTDLLNQASNLGSPYSITYNSNTGKFVFESSNSASFYFDFTQDNQSRTAKLLGFFPLQYSSSNQKITSQTIINMNTIPFLFLDTNFGASGSIITTNQQNMRTFGTGVLIKVPINEDFGDIINFQPNNRHTLIIERKRIHTLRFTLKDNYYNTLDLNAIPFSLTLTIDFVDFGSSGIYNNDPRDEMVKLTREDVNENLTRALIQQGEEALENYEERNKLINLLDLNQSK